VDDGGEQFSKRDPRTRTTVRNLRIREDRAKYLDDLNPSSAFYDPKSRSLRGDFQDAENSFVSTGQQVFQGDDAKFFEMHNYLWGPSNEKPNEVPNLFAEPSAVEVLYEEMTRRKAEVEKDTKKKLAEEYGGEEYMKAPSVALLMGQTEVYKEYTRDGTLITGSEPIPKSKYPEDVHINKHTSVFGSYYDRKTGKWGFGCCKQLDKSSYCTGITLSLRPTDNNTAPTKTSDTEKVGEDPQKQPPPAITQIKSEEKQATSGETNLKEKEVKDTPEEQKKEKKRKRDHSSKKKNNSEDSSDSDGSDSESESLSKKKKKHKHKHKHRSSKKKHKSS